MICLVADPPPEMAERIHMRADLADLGREEFIVPHGFASPAMGSAGRPAGHAQAEDTAGREGNPGIVFMAEPDDFAVSTSASACLTLAGPRRLPLPR